MGSSPWGDAATEGLELPAEPCLPSCPLPGLQNPAEARGAARSSASAREIYSLSLVV